MLLGIEPGTLGGNNSFATFVCSHLVILVVLKYLIRYQIGYRYYFLWYRYFQSLLFGSA